MVRQLVCIGPPAVIASIASLFSTPTGPSITTPVDAPMNAAGGSNLKCGLWYTAISGDICSTISRQYGISLKGFYLLNLAVDDICSNLQAQTAYFVKPVGDITTYPGYDGAGSDTMAPCDVAFPAPTCYQDVATLTSVPFLEPNATFTRAPNASTNTVSRTVSRTTHTPSPTAPGSRYNCLYYAEYIKTGNTTTEKSVKSCRGVAQYYGVTVSQLRGWNTSLKAASCALSPRYVYCAFVRGATATSDSGNGTPAPTTTTPSASKAVSGRPPGPTQTGIAANCNKYAVQSGNQYCYDMAAANGITIDQLHEWNPTLKGDCSGMYPNYAYCVGVSS